MVGLVLRACVLVCMLDCVPAVKLAVKIGPFVGSVGLVDFWCNWSHVVYFLLLTRRVLA